ncbi:uncharacterized protein LOC127857193 [Dreissena polymorpha]|uniref:uncharacterized protein LOC127857193 n=1 Tax=Dreissena polymorpha TaxID=45954 RepID=UPI002265312F|nr:uncharacterized protein LOC127857193 [Dreissena polymorpha]
MKVAIFSLLVLGQAFADISHRGKRQAADCQEPDLPNICTTAGGRVYFPHPTNSRKFLQCSDGGRMFIITCPSGEFYSSAATGCVPLNPVTAAPATNPPITTARPTTASVFNPCTIDNLVAGNIFFPYPGDNRKFIECDKQGNPMQLTCPTRLVFSPDRKACVLAPTDSSVTVGPVNTVTVNPLNPITGNPCTQSNIQSGELFFPHPNPSQYIHCDYAGDAYIMNCPGNLIWNQSVKQCSTAFIG